MHKKRYMLGFLVILIAGAIAYVNASGNEFVWDAKLLINNNPAFHSLKNIPRSFTSTFFESNGKFNFYRPLTSILFMIDYSIWKARPPGYLLTNFILHFINACLVYALLSSIIGRRGVALFLSLFFITHPTSTESVTYIASRSDPLALMFILLSFLSVRRFLENYTAIKWYCISLICFALACLSKETAIAFPVFIYLYLLITKKEGGGGSVKNLWVAAPYFLISATYALFRFAILKGSNSQFLDTMPMGRGILLMNLPITIMKYIAAFALPGPFIVVQPVTLYPYFHPAPFIAAAVLGFALFMLMRSFKSVAAIGTAWFFAFILPTSGIVPINAVFYNHWLYLPSFGLLIITGTLISGFIPYIKKTGKLPEPLITRGLPVAGLAVIIFCCILTIKQNVYFSNDFTFYTETIKKNPNSSIIHYNLGIVYAERGKPDEAIKEYQKAIALNMNYTDAYVNMGVAYQNLNRNDLAEEAFKTAIKISPGSYLPCYHIANLFQETGNISKSVEFYNKALTLDPSRADIYYNLGTAYDKSRNVEDAINAYSGAINRSAGYVEAYLNLGAAYARKGLLEKAGQTWEAGLKLAPNNSDMKKNLEMVERLIEKQPR